MEPHKWPEGFGPVVTISLAASVHGAGRSGLATQIAPAPYVTVPLFSVISGLSEKAIRRKIEDGKWLEGREYRRSPDGGVFISIKGFERWVERG